MKETFENQTNWVKQSLVLLPVNYILIPLCVKICPQACMRDGTTMEKHKRSWQGKIEFEWFKIWSSHIFKQPELNEKLKATSLQEHKKNNCFSVDGNCNHCKKF